MNKPNLTPSFRTKNNGSSSEWGKMNKKQKELLKTACLIQTQSFIEQEFEYFNLLTEHAELITSLQDLNEYVLNLFLVKLELNLNIETNSNPNLREAQQVLNLTFEDFFKYEIIFCFWGNVQYGQDFKNPIHNWFNLNSTRQFHSAYFEVFSLIRNNPEFYAIYLQIQQLASCYDLAALSYRFYLSRDKYLIPTYLEFFIGLHTLSYREDNLEDYYVLINLLTPTDTLKRGVSSVLLQPLNHLSWSDLIGRDKESKLIEIQEGILYFQIPLGQNTSFYKTFFSNYYGLYLLLNKNITSETWSYIEELQDILAFLSQKLNSKKNVHLKEKSTLVAYEALILEYFCMFKKDNYCVDGLSEPNGFNKFLCISLTGEARKASYRYKFFSSSYKQGLKSVDLKFANSELNLSLKHESIRKNLERRKKLYQPSQLLRKEKLDDDSEKVDFSKIIPKLADYNFVER